MIGRFYGSARAGFLSAGISLFAAVALGGSAAGARDLSTEIRNGIDAAIAEAYGAASSDFPCKVKKRRRPRMIRWEDVDRCLNQAAARVDWEALSERLARLRADAQGVSETEFQAAVEASLASRALPFEQALAVKDENVLLPLTNSVLRFLPENSLTGLMVSDKTGTKLGEFVGIYVYERLGGLASANTYRLFLFQYTDLNGNVQAAPDKLLLDSYGVPWKDAAAQPGFRLSSDKLTFRERTR